MKFIPQVQPYITENEIKAVVEYLQSGGWLTEFEKTQEFEKMIADFLGVKYAVVVTSGTVALYLALLSLGIGKNDSVIVPDYTMIASPNSVKWAGAEVILCDIEKDTMCLDLNKVKLKKNTKALMYVSINGRSGNMNKVVEFCKDNNLFLIEDACQAFGSKWNGKFLGTFGDVGCLSFTPHKIITTGQGGAVVTNNEEIYIKVKKLKDFYRTQPGVDWHIGIGYNFKFTDLQAVIGIEQLKTIDYRIKKKKEIYFMYMEMLQDCEFIRFLPIDLENVVPWFVDIIVESEETRDKLSLYLKKMNIGSRPFYPPIHAQIPYKAKDTLYSVASEIAPRGLWLPSSINLTKNDIEYITNTIKNFFMDNSNA
jgi:perosamine synthetase